MPDVAIPCFMVHRENILGEDIHLEGNGIMQPSKSPRI